MDGCAVIKKTSIENFSKRFSVGSQYYKTAKYMTDTNNHESYEEALTRIRSFDETREKEKETQKEIAGKDNDKNSEQVERDARNLAPLSSAVLNINERRVILVWTRKKPKN